MVQIKLVDFCTEYSMISEMDVQSTTYFIYIFSHFGQMFSLRFVTKNFGFAFNLYLWIMLLKPTK